MPRVGRVNRSPALKALVVLLGLAVSAAGCAAGPEAASVVASLDPAVTPSAEPASPSPSGEQASPSASPTTSPAVSVSASASPAPARAASAKAASSAKKAAKPSARATRAAAPAGVGAVGTGRVPVPAQARPADTSRPTRVIGAGTPAGCTSAAVVAAVAAGGVVTFDCGPAPVTIRMTQTAKVRNAHPTLVLDGGGKVTLSGGGARRILYQNTCDSAQGWTTNHCQDQETPSLVVQNLTFADGDATGEKAEGGGGGAIFVRGGRLTVINSRFVRNRCDATGPDVGGAAVRALSQFRGGPVIVSGSSFEGGSCSNGAALSSIGVSWLIVNSRFAHNSATGRGANPATSGSPGGGSGGAIYLDGNRFTLDLRGSVIEDNRAPEGGGAIFFVSNDRTGTATLSASTLRRNPSLGFETAGLPGIFFLGARPPSITAGTTLSR